MPASRFDASPLIVLVGVALLGYGLWQWQAAPGYGDADLAAATELNLALDLSRLGGPKLDEAELALRREAIRKEVEATAGAPRERARGFLMAGSVLIVLGFVRRWLLKRVARAQASDA